MKVTEWYYYFANPKNDIRHVSPGITHNNSCLIMRSSYAILSGWVGGRVCLNDHILDWPPSSSPLPIWWPHFVANEMGEEWGSWKGIRVEGLRPWGEIQCLFWLCDDKRVSTMRWIWCLEHDMKTFIQPWKWFPQRWDNLVNVLFGPCIDSVISNMCLVKFCL